MSGKLVMAVWNADHGDASTVLLLMALADEANDAGECSVNIPNLAAKARQSERNCRYLLRKLEEAQILERFEARGRHHQNAYQLHLKNLDNLQPVQVIKPANLQPVQVIETQETEIAEQSSKPATSAGYRKLANLQPVQVIKPANTATIAGLGVPLPPDPLPQDLNPGEDPLIFPHGGKSTGRIAQAQTDAKTVLEHLNSLTGRKYSAIEHIAARLHQGITLAQCLVVLDWWAAVYVPKSPDMAQYFDNDTPFRKTKFDKYRAAAEAWHAQGRPAWNHVTATGKPRGPYMG